MNFEVRGKHVYIWKLSKDITRFEVDLLLSPEEWQAVTLAVSGEQSDNSPLTPTGEAAAASKPPRSRPGSS